MFEFGIETFVNNQKLLKTLRNKRWALVAHPASVDQNLNHSLDVISELLKKNPVLKKSTRLTSAFGPQHGLRGEKQDNMIETEDYRDPDLGIPVYSLYGKVRKPTDQMMDSFDVCLFDLQDVGCRIYTFLTTLFYMMDACAQKNKTLVVLDRPNPAGREVEGTLLAEGYFSFVGAAKIPMRHGMTLGEMALWYKVDRKLKLNLIISKMKGYKPNSGFGFGWPATPKGGELTWVNPSPNAASLNMTRCFPGTVMLEGTTLSEGRGTTRALEVIGAPDIDFRKVINEMKSIAPHWLKGARIRHCFFEPTFHKHAGKLCNGFQIHASGEKYFPKNFKPYRVLALAFKAIRNLYPDYRLWRDFEYEYEKDRLAIDLINGGTALREWVDAKEQNVKNSNQLFKNFENKLTVDEKYWSKARQKFLIY
jgi:uncharacterized protein YbbC (DUF1343 family)